MKGKILGNILLLAVLAAGCDDTVLQPSAPETNTTENSNPVDKAPPSGTQTSNPNTSGSSGSGQQPAPALSTPVAPTPSTPATSVAATQPATQAPAPAAQSYVQRTEGQTAQNMDSPTGTVRQYLAYVPKGYNAEPGRKWPVVLFLHGMGEQGTDVNKIYWTYFAWKTMDKGYPYILITPQLLSGHDSWSAADLNKLLDEVLPKYNVDYSRIIVTGYSMGAHGVFDVAEYNPGRFAAAVPIAGWGDTNRAYTLKDVAVWAFHGDSDPTVNVSGSVNMINAIKNAGGVKTNLTIYPGKGHDIHAMTYDNQAIIDWMLAQRK